MEPQGNNSVEWYFAGNFNNSSEELLNYNEHVKLTSQQRDLTIYDVQVRQLMLLFFFIELNLRESERHKK